MTAAKNLALTLAALAALTVGAGLVCYRASCEPALHAAAVAGDTMSWLRSDFHLTAAQAAEIEKLQAAYAPSCDEHCRLIRAATQARDALAAARHVDAAAVAQARQRLQDLRTACESALTRHVRQVAAVMGPEDGRRYLALVLPKIAAFDHTAAPDAGLNHPH